MEQLFSHSIGQDEKDHFPPETDFPQLKGKKKGNVGQKKLYKIKRANPTHTLTQKHIYRAIIFTRLSSLFATMEAKRLSPANSEMRKMYSGAVT